MNRKWLVKLVGGMALCTGLLVTNKTSEAAIHYDYYNEHACEEFGLSDDYINAFEKKFIEGFYSNDLRNINMANTNTKAILENQIKALLAINLETGIGFNEYGGYKEIPVGEVSNAITIHFDGADYKIVGGGDTVVSNLILNYVKGIGCISTNSYVYNKNGHKLSTMKQPIFKVNGNDIDLYIPYVYYNKETRKYFANQLASKLKVLTGKTYDVTIKTSSRYYADLNKQQANLSVNSVDGLAIEFSILLMNAYNSQRQDFNDFYGVDVEFAKSLPTSKNPNPSVIVFDGFHKMFKLADYLTLRGTAISDAAKLNYSIGECQRIAFAELLYLQFMYPCQMRVEFADYAVTLRDNYTVEIKPPYVYE